MSAPPHVSKEATPFKDVLFVALTMITVALAIAVWQQRREIRRLTPHPPEPLAPSVTLRRATAHDLLLTPPVETRPIEERTRPNATDDSGDDALQRYASTSASRPSRAGASPLSRLLENPEFYSALALHRQATLDTRFAELFRRLDLGTTELAAFKRLLAEKENVALDVVAVSEARPEGPLPTETLKAGVNAARAQVEAAIRDSLGNERYNVYQDYVQTLPQRTVVAQLEQRLSYSPTPLSPAQSDSLVRILVAHAPPAPTAEPAHPATVVVDATTPAVAALTENRAPVAVVNNAALTEARTLLTPTQITALQEIQTEQQASIRALQLLRDSLPSDRSNLPFGLLWQ